MNVLKLQDRERHSRITVAFTGAAGLGAAGDVPLFTVSGEILVTKIISFCTEDLVSGGGGNLILGTTNTTNLFIGATTATAVDANEYWVTTTPTRSIALPAACKDILVGNENILATVGVADVTDGTIIFDLYWLPVSESASVAPAF